MFLDYDGQNGYEFWVIINCISIVFLVFGFEGRLSCFTKNGGAIEQRNGLDFFFLCIIFSSSNSRGDQKLNLLTIYL